MAALKVVDFFCGAGGFSEGFRQQGFVIEQGVDHWRPAVESHNINHGLTDEYMDILLFEGPEGLDRIEDIEDCDVIIGSPPCVSFSMSNKAGKADKGLGIRLINAFLRVVAVRKYHPDEDKRILAWLMENVPNSRRYVKSYYTFEDLELEEWRVKNDIDSGETDEQGKQIALRLKEDDSLEEDDRGGIYCAADYGSPQTRKRFICGEVIDKNKFPTPERTHSIDGKDGQGKDIEEWVVLGDILENRPDPSDKKKQKFVDPNYPGLILKRGELTDHFYDSGVYEVEWKKAKYLKTSHPFMGKMSLPERLDKPSRTIMATRSASTREALLYESKWKYKPREDGKQHGKYRLPTIREIATLMGFPYTYNFSGSEGTKWKQIGNAVCPHMSSALAKAILRDLDRSEEIISKDKIDFSEQRNAYKNESLINLNDLEKDYDKPPKIKPDAKFRRHPIKKGNMTVELMNYDPGSAESKIGSDWNVTIFLGSGKSYQPIKVDEVIYKKVRDILIDDLEEGKAFADSFRSEFKDRIPPVGQFQDLYVNPDKRNGKLDPTSLVDEIGDHIKVWNSERWNDEIYINRSIKDILGKDIPYSQLCSIFAVGSILFDPKFN